MCPAPGLPGDTLFFPKGIIKAGCGPGVRTILGLLLELLWGWSRDTPAQPPAEKGGGHQLTPVDTCVYQQTWFARLGAKGMDRKRAFCKGGGF